MSSTSNLDLFAAEEWSLHSGSWISDVLAFSGPYFCDGMDSGSWILDVLAFLGTRSLNHSGFWILDSGSCVGFGDLFVRR